MKLCPKVVEYERRLDAACLAFTSVVKSTRPAPDPFLLKSNPRLAVRRARLASPFSPTEFIRVSKVARDSLRECKRPENRHKLDTLFEQIETLLNILEVQVVLYGMGVYEN